MATYTLSRTTLADLLAWLIDLLLHRPAPKHQPAFLGHQAKAQRQARVHITAILQRPQRPLFEDTEVIPVIPAWPAEDRQFGLMLTGDLLGATAAFSFADRFDAWPTMPAAYWDATEVAFTAGARILDSAGAR